MVNLRLRLVLTHLHRLVGTGQPGALSDAQLLERFAAGHDEAAFTALMERHGPQVLAVCRRVLHDAHAAEDACQATFLVLARKAGSIRHKPALGSWLYRVAYHLALKANAEEARRRKHERHMSAVWRRRSAVRRCHPRKRPGWSRRWLGAWTRHQGARGPKRGRIQSRWPTHAPKCH